MTETRGTAADPTSFDVVVIGGGAAGLSGAVTLGRSRRRTLLVDAGAQRNRPAGGIHNLVTRDGMTPADFVAAGRAEVERYGGVVRDGTVTGVERSDAGFRVTVDDDAAATVTARRLLVTTGLVDELPDVPGLSERWGRDVIHCPYCHGYEFRDRRIGVLSTGPMTAHAALLFGQLSADVVVLAHTGPQLEDADAARLRALGVRVVPGRVEGLVVAGDRLCGVRLTDGTVVERDALAVAPRAVSRATLLGDLGLTTAPHPLGAALGEHVPTVDPTGRTRVDGVWVAGNVSDLMAQVVTAAGQGVMAAAAINADLALADADAAAATVAATTSHRHSV
ncbi:NAD(P)/FAD-dependent oxidoreductase [Jatrophihabitans endophyticus]|nr:NAD(P)/FAD-dependent oxidoreductase [Jatrophihabitans endophyticus]